VAAFIAARDEVEAQEKETAK
jgi:hypothetical protein